MEIRGIGFVGSHTTAHVAMGAFLRNVLGLSPIAIDGVGAALFAASNGDVLAVAPPDEEDSSTERTIGLIVDDLDGAIAELHAAGVETPGSARTPAGATPTSGCQTGSSTSSSRSAPARTPSNRAA